MSGLVSLGLRNLLRSPRRTAMTLLSLVVGSAGLVYTLGYMNRVERYLREVQIHLLQTGHISVYSAPGYDLARIRPQLASFDPDEQARMRAVFEADPAVERVVPLLLGAGMATNGCESVPFDAIGVDPAQLKIAYSNPALNEEADELIPPEAGVSLWELEGAEAPVVVTPGLAALLGKTAVRGAATRADPSFVDCAAADKSAKIAEDAWVQLAGRRWDGGLAVLDAEIGGRFRTGFTEYENGLLMAPLPLLQRFYGTDDVSAYAVFLHDPDDVEDVRARLDAALHAAGLQVVTYPWWSPITSPNYTSMVPLVQVMAGFILVIMLCVVSLSVANAMTMSLLERLREIGTLRAIGFTPRHVLGVVLVEAAALAIVGAAVGIAVGLAMGAAVNASDLRYEPPAIAGSLQFMVRPTPSRVLASAALVVGLSLVSTLLVARRQLGRRVVDLLQS